MKPLKAKKKVFIFLLMNIIIPIENESKNEIANVHKELSKDILMLEEKFKIAIEKEPYIVTEVILHLEEIKHLLKFKEIYFESNFIN